MTGLDFGSMFLLRQGGHSATPMSGIGCAQMCSERCAQILPSGSDNLMGIAEGFQPEYGSCSTRGLLWESGSMLQEGADLTEGSQFPRT